jgi:hypothetical protein
MNRFAWRSRAVAAVVILLFAAACDNPNEPEPTVESVEIGQTSAVVPVGNTQQLNVTLKDAAGRVLTGRQVTWFSSDTAVATVTTSGLVTGRAAGPATITARSEGRSGHAPVLVTTVPDESPPPPPPPPPSSPTQPGPVATIELDLTRAEVEEGEVLQITATPRDAEGNPITGLAIQWRTSDETIAQVTWGGRVSAIRTGTATITVRVHGKEATATVEVTASYPYDLLYSAVMPGTSIAELFRLDMRRAEGQPERLLPAGTAVYMARSTADGSRIVFTGAVNGEPGIYVANRDGSGLRGVVTSVPGVVGDLTLSPDGGRVAFLWQQPGEQWGQIWAANVDGEPDLVSLTADLGDARVRMPAWSPEFSDGSSRIAYVHQINGIVARIWTMRLDGSEKRQITTGDFHDDHPAWSPDGETIVFERMGTSSALWLVRSVGGGERHLVGGGLGRRVNPAWSPDGKLIAFAIQHNAWSGGNIFTVWADGSKVAQRSVGETRSQNPVWLPRQ